MKQKSEVNVWSVTWGVLMAVLFSAAAAYLGLKVGQVFEAAIPIAIIAVGVSAAAKRSNACHLYLTGEVPGDECRLPEDFHCLSIRWCPRHPVPDSVPPLLCGGSTGAVPLP